MILRLFVAYRDMEARVDRAEATADLLRDRIAILEDQLAAEREHYRELADKANGDLRNTVDFLAQGRYGGGIFDRAPILPQQPMQPVPMMPTRVQASALVAEQLHKMEAEFLKQSEAA